MLLIFMIAILLILFAIIFVINVHYYKKNVYRYATNHYLAYSIMIAFFLIYLLPLKGIFRIKDPETWGGIFDNVISNYIVAFFVIFLLGLEKKLKSKGEDKEKQRHDYDALAKQYFKEENLVSRSAENYYPVVNMGSFNINIYNKTNQHAVELDRIVIDDSQNLYRLPVIIENNFSVLMSAHDTSTLFNNLNIRVKKMEYRDNRLFLETERTYYFYSLVTNRAPDFAWDGLTVRELFEPGPRLLPLEWSALSNHLGFNGFVESSDGYICFVKRSENVSVGKRIWGDSIQASLKTKYALDENGEFTRERLADAVLREIEDELKIKSENCSTVKIIGIYRDLVEAGKPQFLVYAKTELTAIDISKEFHREIMTETHPSEKANHQKRYGRIVEKKVQEDGSELIWVLKDDLIERTVFGEQGISVPTMTFDYECNSILNSENMFLEMVPSSAAAVIMLQAFLQNEK